jgi:hypothetical protein
MFSRNLFRRRRETKHNNPIIFILFIRMEHSGNPGIPAAIFILLVVSAGRDVACEVLGTLVIEETQRPYNFYIVY